MDFYPRPPCGGRPDARHSNMDKRAFLSTSPLRGTTQQRAYREANREFLSTSPLRGTTHYDQR